jgi:hypothetical protein
MQSLNMAYTRVLEKNKQKSVKNEQKTGKTEKHIGKIETIISRNQMPRGERPRTLAVVVY